MTSSKKKKRDVESEEDSDEGNEEDSDEDDKEESVIGEEMSEGDGGKSNNYARTLFLVSYMPPLPPF